MKLTWTQFSGIRPQADKRLLPAGNAQVAANVNTERGGLTGIEAVSNVAATLSKLGVKTIYRFGLALDSEVQFWFHWTTDVDVVKGPIADDTAERTYWTGDGPPKYTTTALGTSGSNYPGASRPLGVSAPNSAPLGTVSGTPTVGGSVEARVYFYTFVTDNGEESAPSGTKTISVQAGETVTLSGLLTTATNGAVLASKRIYRAQRGSYLFVAEIPVASLTFVDNVASDALGEVCPSIEWDEPSPTMTALTGGANGMLAAIDGYTVRLCEPFRPHAWPQKYAQTVMYPAVGLGYFGNSFVVLTTGFPYILTGSHPGNVSMAPAEFYQPCVSKRSIVSTGNEVLWASPDGLVSMGQGGSNVLTQGIFTPAQWRALKPETMLGEWHEGWYVGSHTPVDASPPVGFMFRPATQEWVTLPNQAVTAMYRDTVGDALYLCIGDQIKKFRGGAAQSYTWKSQEVVTPLTDFVAARVTGDYPLTFKFYRDNVLAHTKTVADDEPFKLPAKLGRAWAVEVSGANTLLGIALATSEQEL